MSLFLFGSKIMFCTRNVQFKYFLKKPRDIGTSPAIYIEYTYWTPNSCCETEKAVLLLTEKAAAEAVPGFLRRSLSQLIILPPGVSLIGTPLRSGQGNRRAVQAWGPTVKYEVCWHSFGMVKVRHWGRAGKALRSSCLKISYILGVIDVLSIALPPPTPRKRSDDDRKDL